MNTFGAIASDIYSYEFDGDSVQFSKIFLEDMRTYVENINKYQRIKFIKDYGTHFVYSADFGAIRYSSQIKDKSNKK